MLLELNYRLYLLPQIAVIVIHFVRDFGSTNMNNLKIREGQTLKVF